MADSGGHSGAGRRWTLVAATLGSSMVFLNMSTVNIALPTFQRTMGAGLAEIQWIVNAFTLLLAALILVGGSLGDRFGRRRLFVAGAVTFAAASVACGLAAGPLALIAARAAQGIGGAMLAPNSLALVSAAYPGEGRGRAIGLWAGVSSFAAAGGPLLAGWLLDTFSWPWIFFVHAPLAVVVVAIALRAVPESRDEASAHSTDGAGGLLVVLALGLVTFGLIEASDRAFTDPLVAGSLVGGLVLFAGFVWHELRAETPMVPLQLFASRRFRGANAITLLLYAALSGVFFFLPLNLIQVQGYSPTAAGAATLPTFLLLALLSSWSGGLVRTVGARNLLVSGSVLAGLGAALLGLPGIGGSYWVTFFPGLFVLGLGLALAVAPVTTTVMSAVADRYAGTASGINNAVARVAGLLGIAILGIVMASAFGRALRADLTATSLPPSATETVLARRSDLVEIELPPGLTAEERDAANAAVREAFVDGFRIVMGANAALAFLAAAVAWRTMGENAA